MTPGIASTPLAFKGPPQGNTRSRPDGSQASSQLTPSNVLVSQRLSSHGGQGRPTGVQWAVDHATGAALADETELVRGRYCSAKRSAWVRYVVEHLDEAIPFLGAMRTAPTPPSPRRCQAVRSTVRQ